MEVLVAKSFNGREEDAIHIVDYCDMLGDVEIHLKKDIYQNVKKAASHLGWETEDE